MSHVTQRSVFFNSDWVGLCQCMSNRDRRTMIHVEIRCDGEVIV